MSQTKKDIASAVRQRMRKSCNKAISYLREHSDLNLEPRSDVASGILLKAFQSIEEKLQAFEAAVEPSPSEDGSNSLLKRNFELRELAHRYEKALRDIAQFESHELRGNTGGEMMRRSHASGSRAAFTKCSEIANQALGNVKKQGG